jgi:hypothetical protein
MECVKYVGGKILKPRIKSSNGLYPAYRVSISQNGCAKDYYIHRLVLLAFVGECPIGMECCHNDGNSLNNKVENLRWYTPKNNQADSIRHGTKSGIPICPSKGEKHYNSKLTEELIYELRELIVYRGMYKKLSEKYDVSPSTIRQAVKGITWKHL